MIGAFKAIKPKRVLFLFYVHRIHGLHQALVVEGGLCTTGSLSLSLLSIHLCPTNKNQYHSTSGRGFGGHQLFPVKFSPIGPISNVAGDIRLPDLPLYLSKQLRGWASASRLEHLLPPRSPSPLLGEIIAWTRSQWTSANPGAYAWWIMSNRELVKCKK